MRLVILCGIFASLCLSPAAAANPATTFAMKCSVCHTVGRGVLVGPDLKGVTDRRPRTWLAAWLASPAALIASGDAAAVALADKFKPLRMPDMGLSSHEIAALIEYLAAGGPEADARRARRVESATPVEIEMGHALFVGRLAFASGGPSCFSCHRLGKSLGAGGTLGPDLSTAYTRYRDKALAALLGRGCFPGAAPKSKKAALTDEELFALKAFMRRETRDSR
jgi:cytochrome c2